MRRLIYASRWAPSVREDAQRVLQNIVAKSIHNNRLADVTGFLISHNGVFIQALEGPDAAVAEIDARIQADPRNADRTVLVDDAVEGRAFRGWSMAGARCWNEAIAAEIDQAARTGFSDVPTDRWLAILHTVAAVDMGRVPCTVAA